MPISVVVGGQFGSEGKGKTALEIARQTKAHIVVRVGGTNSGHTAVDQRGKTWALRQLPVSVLAPNTIAVLPPGALIDPEIFEREVRELGLEHRRVIVSPHATVILTEDKEAEQRAGFVARIGSTGSGPVLLSCVGSTVTVQSPSWRANIQLWSTIWATQVVSCVTR